MGCGCSAEYQKPAEVVSKSYPELFAKMPSMQGKVVAITGCTTGTGFILAKTCAKLGAEVVMLNRPSSRADEALKAIKDEFPECKVTLVPCDLMKFMSVRDAGAQLRKDFDSTGIDVLCNNAGIMAVKDEATTDGCDTQMQVNHLSQFLLTAEVWPLLKKAADKTGEARVVNHSSAARNGPQLDAKYLEKNGGNLGGDATGWMPFTGARWSRYQQSKLANVVFTYALDDKIKAAGSKVMALVAHPGGATTNLQVTTVSDGGMAPGFTKLFMGQMQSGEDGACGIISCCCMPGVSSGEFWGPTGLVGPAVLLPKEPEVKRADEASRTMLWDVSMRITECQGFDM